MLFTAEVRESFRNELPKNYNDLSFWDKLYVPRSVIPAVTHLDYSARLQTVNKETNPLFHKLLTVIKEKTGHAILVNTSFNVRGEPIVCTPEDAFRCFMGTEMDFLVIENFLFEKAKQPFWENKEKWVAAVRND
jgi:carbamoyltransferase